MTGDKIDFPSPFDQAVHILTAKLTGDVDVGMGHHEPLLEVYKPEGLAIVLARALNDAGLLISRKTA